MTLTVQLAVGTINEICCDVTDAVPVVPSGKVIVAAHLRVTESGSKS
jgi:hypothetical protein